MSEVFLGGRASPVTVQNQLYWLILVELDHILWGKYFLVFPPTEFPDEHMTCC